jgi:uncharacterized protein YpbB
VNLPDTLPGLKKIKGIGKRLAEKYGQDLVALVSAYRREHHIEEVILAAPVQTNTPLEKEGAATTDTKQISLDMLASGLTIPEIAKERGLVNSTIEGHLAFFIETGQLAIDTLLTADKQQTIRDQLAKATGPSLSEVKLALGDGTSYGEIKMVLAHLKRLPGEPE